MKLATLKNDTRDGELVVVSKDLTRYARAFHIAPTMQLAIENWNDVEPKLVDIYARLNDGRIADALPFDPKLVSAPLPRSYQFVDASAFLNHGDIMQRAFNLDIDIPEGTPILVQRQGDDFTGPCDDYPLLAETENGDFEGEIAVIVDDIATGTTADDSYRHIKLFMLLNDVSLRAHVSREMQMGFGFINAKPATTFAPVAVTPDELGDAWTKGRVCLDLHVHRNGELFGHPNGAQMDFSFGKILQHLCYSRNIRAGAVIATGTFSNTNHQEVGSACLAERRALEVIEQGKAETPFLRFGDRLTFQMFDQQGNSIFGAIDQRFVEHKGAES